MKNRKGFTLVELLTVIVILGLVALISIPLVNNLTDTFSKKQYTSYRDAVTASAKLYNDSYSEDLFGHNENGCAYVSYQQLTDKKLLNDIKVKDMSCDSEHTFVRIQKVKNKYYYSTYIACWDKKRGSRENPTITVPDGIHNMDPEYCTGTEPNNIAISVNESEIGTVFNKKRKTTKVTLKSGTGINTNIIVYAGWSKTTSSTGVTDWQKLDLKVKANQEQEIQNGHIISTTSQQLVTPENESGAHYLIVRVDRLSDLYGTAWKNPTPANGKYVAFGPFSIDNEKPTIETFTITSKQSSYNSLNVKLTIKGKDTYTPDKDLKMCISEDNSKCTTAAEFEKYVTEKEMTLSGSYDNKERTVYITFKDLAGNTKKTSKKYKVAIKNTITYNANGGNACDPKTKNVYYNEGTTKAWGDLCLPTRTGYTFTSWNTKKDGTGTKVTKDTVANGNITVYAQWRINKIKIYYHMNGGTLASAHASYIGTSGDYITSGGSTIVYNLDYGSSLGENGLANYNNPDGVNIVKTGHAAVSKKEFNTKADGTGTSYDQTVAYAASKFCNAKAADCSVTLYVNWKASTYTIAYNANGGSGAPKSHTYTYAATGTTNLATGTPTLKGNAFQGWSLDKDAKTASYSAGQAWKLSNIPSDGSKYTLYAVWKAKTYTIAYDANGGTGAPKSHTYTYATTGTTNLSSDIPTRTGYTFLGWSLDKNATARDYKAGQAWKLSNVPSGTTYTLYAVWKASSYTITYNANGGSGAPASQSYTYATSGTINLSTTKPTRTGYTFLGWSLSRTATSASYTAGQAWNKSNADNYTLYAVWSINKVIIKYNLNGGTWGSSTDTHLGVNASNVVTYDNSDTAWNYNYNGTINLCDYNNPGYINIYKTGYKAKSTEEWCTGTSGNGTCYNQDPDFTNVGIDSTASTHFCNAQTSSCTVNLYVNWTPISYSISYNLDGGSASNKSSYTIETSSFTLNNPTKSGYKFKGWTGSNGSTPSTSVTIKKGSTGNKSYTANWEKNSAGYNKGCTPKKPFERVSDAALTSGKCGTKGYGIITDLGRNSVFGCKTEGTATKIADSTSWYNAFKTGYKCNSSGSVVAPSYTMNGEFDSHSYYNLYCTKSKIKISKCGRYSTKYGDGCTSSDSHYRYYTSGGKTYRVSCTTYRSGSEFANLINQTGDSTRYYYCCQ